MNGPKMILRRVALLSALSAIGMCPLGCHSAFVSATLVNHSGHAVRLVEMDYPNASFGTEQLKDGATFNYRFKIMGSGHAALSWTDASGTDHNSRGPALAEGQEGQLTLEIGQSGAAWQQNLRR